MAIIHGACPAPLRAVFDELAEGSYQQTELFETPGGPAQTVPTHTPIPCFEGKLVLSHRTWQLLGSFHADVSSRVFRYRRRGRTLERVILQPPVLIRSELAELSSIYWVSVRLISLR